MHQLELESLQMTSQEVQCVIIQEGDTLGHQKVHLIPSADGTFFIRSDHNDPLSEASILAHYSQQGALALHEFSDQLQ